MTPKSTVTLFRKAVGLKGKSQHLGRGFYQCTVTDDDLTQADIFEKCEQAGQKLESKGFATMKKDGEHLVIDVLSSVTGHEYYNKIVVHPVNGCFGQPGWSVCM